MTVSTRRSRLDDPSVGRQPIAAEGERSCECSTAGAPGADVEERPLPLRCAARALIRCAWRTAVLVAERRIRQPDANVGRRIAFADRTSGDVYRETVIEGASPAKPSVLVVCNGRDRRVLDQLRQQVLLQRLSREGRSASQRRVHVGWYVLHLHARHGPHTSAELALA